MKIDQMSETEKIREAKRQLAEYDRIKAHDEFEYLVLMQLKDIAAQLKRLLEKLDTGSPAGGTTGGGNAGGNGAGCNGTGNQGNKP